MTDKTSTIYRALGQIAWGYVFLYLDFSITFNGLSLNLLPDWGGYLLLLSAIALLGDTLRDLPLLRPFGILLTIQAAVDWVWKLLTGSGLTDQFYLLSALIICVSIYFHFQLLTDLARLADSYSLPADTLRFCRNADAVLRVISLLPVGILGEEPATVFTLALLVGWLLVCIILVWQLFALRRRFAAAVPPEG